MDESVNKTRSDYNALLEDSDDDEWYYTSIKRFEQLEMFNLETSAYHLDLSENDQICCTGKTRNNQQEIQEFILPERFSTSTFESHDLKLKSGGFSSKPVYQMKCFQGQRKLVLSEEGSIGASIYELGCENSDFIKKVSVINCDVEKPQLAVCSNEIALGSSTRDIHLADIDTSKVISTLQPPPDNSAEDILGLSFVDSSTIAYCEPRLDRIRLLDCRSHASKIYTSADSKHCHKGDSLAKVWHSFSVQHNRNFFGLISSQGNVVIYDSRSVCHFPLIETKVEINSSLPVGCFLQLLFSPHGEDVFSVSGINGAVNVFSIEADAIKQIFSYDGHNRHQSRKNVFVSNHIWSPVQRNLLYSSAKDGSLHCWKFIEHK